MKVQVRRGCFETNSSSQHCIAIIKPDHIKGTLAEHYGWELTAEWKDPGEEVEVNHPIVLNDSSLDFERAPFRVLTTMYKKIQYAIASYGTEEKFREISDICKELTGHPLKMPTYRKFRSYVYTGLKEGDEIPEDRFLPDYKVEYDKEKKKLYRIVNGRKRYDVDNELFEKPYFGYVDHQSLGVLQGFLDEHKISLKEFLQNPKYIVVIDGDEYCAWEALFEAGVCQKENFIETGIYEYDYPKEGEDEP